LLQELLLPPDTSEQPRRFSNAICDSSLEKLNRRSSPGDGERRRAERGSGQ
jgi:hypothetical protein